MSKPDDGFGQVEKLKAGDEVWIVIGDENWLKRIVEIYRNPDGSYSITLEDGIDALAE